MLICGDVGGNIRVLLFSPVLRGPFQNEPGRALQSLRHIDLQKRVRLWRVRLWCSRFIPKNNARAEL